MVQPSRFLLPWFVRFSFIEALFLYRAFESYIPNRCILAFQTHPYHDAVESKTSIIKSISTSSSSLFYSRNEIRDEVETKSSSPVFDRNFNQFQSSPLSRYLRIKPVEINGKRFFLFQTAIQTFEKQIIDQESGKSKTVTLDLHAQVHFGDHQYFEFYNSADQFSSRYDRVHYELVVDQDLVTTDFSPFAQDAQDDLIRTLLMPRNGLMPSIKDTNTALQHDLCCQVDIVDYSQPNWVYADLTRQEFQALPPKSKKQVKTDKNSPLTELFDALIRPTTPASPGIKTQLFSNLFLPGDGIASFFRILLWTTVPCPELSILLLDWSISWPRAGGISPIALSVFQSLILGQIGTARKLIFSQMLVSAQINDGSQNLLITSRNDCALRVLMYSIEQNQCYNNALLYGALHCRDLQSKLMELGFQPLRRNTRTSWRTAWSMRDPILNNSSGKEPSSSSRFTIGIGALGLPLYLVIGGLDWVATLQDITSSLEMDNHWVDAMLSIIFYIARHAGLYLGLAKFIVEWDSTLFGNANESYNGQRR